MFGLFNDETRLRRVVYGPRARTLLVSGLLLLAAAPTMTLAQPAPPTLPGSADAQPASTPTDKGGSFLTTREIPVYPGTLSPSTAVSLAIARHPEIRGAEAVIARRQADLALAEANRWPTITYGVGPGFGRSYGTDGNEGAVRGSLDIQMPVWDFGATRNRITAATELEASARSSRIDTAERVAQTTLTAYADAAAAQERLAAAGHSIEAMRQVRGQIEQRVKAGLSNRSDLNAAQIAVRRAEVDTVRERAGVDAALSRLIELIGVSAERLVPLKDSYEIVAFHQRGEPDFEQAPAIQAAVKALEAAAAQEEIARAERFPAINLGASRTMSTGTYSANDATWIGFMLKGNFSLGGAARQRIAAAVADREAARQELEDKRLQARTTWQVAVREEESARQRMNDLAEVSTLWQSTRELYWGEYILDKRSLGDVINAEREIYTSSAEQVSVLAEALVAAMKARVAQGGLVVLLDGQAGQPAGAVASAGQPDAAVAKRTDTAAPRPPRDSETGNGLAAARPLPPIETAASTGRQEPVAESSDMGQQPIEAVPPSWQLQLGIFSKQEQAEAAWDSLRTQPVLAGQAPVFQSSGPFTRLLTGSFDDQTEAVGACAAIKSAGHNACVAVAFGGAEQSAPRPASEPVKGEAVQKEQIGANAPEMRAQAPQAQMPQAALEGMSLEALQGTPPQEPVPQAPEQTLASSSWQLQLGVFSKREQAQAVWKTLQQQPVLAGRAAEFLQAGPFIRLLATPFGGRSQATEACATLKAVGHNACVAVAPAAETL
ncbi:MAG: TolC family protein [Burkholderiaceae bacterium]|jgi:adhesin transport system outer membrane protein|nr:TolC family protein [Burkholderiaceae bacterium]